VVGGEWAYEDGLAGPHGAAQGISSSGLGLFGPEDRFPGDDLQAPDSVDGVQYGILSAGDLTGTGNGGITGSGGLVKNSVTFVLSGFIGDLSSITNVSFQYGTSLREPNIQTGTITTEDVTTEDIETETVVPEPTTLALLGTGLLGVARSFRRKKRAAAAAAAV